LKKIPLQTWINTGKVKVDYGLRMMELTNEYGFDKYFGQVNENDQYHGIGRHCMVSG
jgi:hypothetical protein